MEQLSPDALGTFSIIRKCDGVEKVVDTLAGVTAQYAAADAANLHAIRWDRSAEYFARRLV